MDDGLQQRTEDNRSLASLLVDSIDYCQYICYRVSDSRNRTLQIEAANGEWVAPDESGEPGAETADCLIGGGPLCCGYGPTADLWYQPWWALAGGRETGSLRKKSANALLYSEGASQPDGRLSTYHNEQAQNLTKQSWQEVGCTLSPGF